MLNIILTIVVVIVLLGVLIGLHEAGHLAVAKMCNVYCAEYSIGFGPKIFSLKRKKGETAFSVRALPFGGFVSMYGEGTELPDGLEIPKERSLEGISKWKRAAIIGAGIVVNFLLSLIFAYVYALSFPNYALWQRLKSDVINPETQSQIVTGIMNVKDSQGNYLENGEYLFNPGSIFSNPRTSGKDQVGGWIVDTQAKVNNSSEDYVVLFYPSTVVSESDFIANVSFYKALTPEEAKAKGDSYFVYGWGDNLLNLDAQSRERLGIYNFPDFENKLTLESGDKVVIGALSVKKINDNISDDNISLDSLSKKTIESTAVISSTKVAFLPPAGLICSFVPFYSSFSNRMANGTEIWTNYWVSLGIGLQRIFTGSIGSVGGVVAMGAQIGGTGSAMGWGYSFFVYGGYISLNLALLNLFPFPGLDGWSLAVTAYEGITKKKVKEKTKNIVSYIGLAVIMTLAIVITVMDILRVTNII